MDKSDSLKVPLKLKVVLRSAPIRDGKPYQQIIGIVMRHESLAMHLAMVLVRNVEYSMTHLLSPRCTCAM